MRLTLTQRNFLLCHCLQVPPETQKEESPRGQIVEGQTYRAANVCVFVMMYNK